MRTAFTSAWVVGVAIVWCATVAVRSQGPAQTFDEELRWARDLTARLATEGFAWEWIPAIQSGRIPIVPSEKRLLVGIWRPAGQDYLEGVSVSVYRVANVKDAQRWIKPNPLPEGWRRRSYNIADDSWLAEHSSGQIQISFRRGRLVASVSGKDLKSVDRVARHISTFDVI